LAGLMRLRREDTREVTRVVDEIAAAVGGIHVPAATVEPMEWVVATRQEPTKGAAATSVEGEKEGGGDAMEGVEWEGLFTSQYVPAL